MEKSKKGRRVFLGRNAMLGCAMSRHRSKFCFGICKPLHGLGACGRLAPHSLRGRTQIAIANHLALAKKESEKSLDDG
jgi:hypothetical protein